MSPVTPHSRQQRTLASLSDPAADATRLAANFDEKAELFAAAARVRARVGGPALWQERARPLVSLYPSQSVADWQQLRDENRALATRAQALAERLGAASRD